MSEWKTIKIVDASLEIIDGDRGKNYPKQSDFSPEGYCLFLNAGNVTKDGFNFANTLFITQTKDEVLRKGKLKREDIVLTTRGTVGNVALYNNKIPYDNVRINSGMVIFRVNPNDISADYLYHYLRSEMFQNSILCKRSGSAQPQLPIRDIKTMNLRLPPVKIQRKIARVLSSLDDKIELNAQINHNLEEQAKAIFKSWFVDFEPFQDERFVETEYGSIPKSWRLITLGEVTEEIRTKIKNKTTTVFSAIKTGELTPSEEYFTKQVYSKDISKYIEVAPLTFAYNPARVNIGSLGLNKFPYTGCVSPVYVVFKSESEYHHFFDFTFKRAFFREEVRVRASGSVRQSLSYADFSLIKIIYPPNDVVEKFNQIYGKISASIRHNQKEIQTLALLRDTLLPKLMSGELDISEVQV